MASPSDSVTVLKGVGAQLADRLARLGIVSLQDLLFHLPRDYADRTRITPIGALQPLQQAVIEGEIRASDVVFGKRRSLVCRLQDHTGTVTLRFYHFSGAQKAKLQTGTSLRCFGETRRGASGLELYHPEYTIVGANTQPLEQTLTPIYSTTEGISQQRLRGLIKQALTYIKGHDIKSLISLTDTNTEGSLLARLAYLHTPPKDVYVEQLRNGDHPYQSDLIVEELAAYQLSLLRLKNKRRQKNGLPIPPAPEAEEQLLSALPFPLTSAQQRVIDEIYQDLEQSQPMMRLLQGDVGSGKTIVAALAALRVAADGYQVAVMAPTEILADQHVEQFQQWLEPLNISIGLLNGRQKVGERREQLKNLEEGTTQIVIGTHALFQEEVAFHNLALVIIDEQHRFGVHQRLDLRNKGIDAQERLVPHQLIMTATPIPRTLAMSAYADLDYSVIDELPKGRIPVSTVVISQQKRDAVIERIHHACRQKRQAYWVCTLIEQSDELEAQAAEETAELLQQSLPDLNIGLVHGRLKPAEKEAVMLAFKQGEIDLLVATTVIEVGVNVPNASLMIIENPERLGLAQLHQLRGRVGRGNTESHCVLLYGDKLSLNGKERLQAMRSTNDGFKIAEIDLQLRGPGEVLGTRQTGDIDFKLANLQRDLHLMPQVNGIAKKLLQEQPGTVTQLIDRWLANREKYTQA